MDNSLYYLELSSQPIRFDPVSPITNVFFDDSNRQVFAVRSGGATGVVVKGPSESQITSFCMEDKGPIRSIKFSPDNKILAVQRTELAVEFISFNNNQPNLNEILTYKGKNSEVFGFVWVAKNEVALIQHGGVEIFIVIPEKRQLKSIKAVNLTINWFAWCPTGNFALLSSNNGTILTPVLLKQGTITKLPRLEIEHDRNVLERDVTLGQIYGTAAILILRQTPNRLIEVVIYLLNGPGLAPKKCHILRLGHSGRFAMNIVDDLIIVHHQASMSSMIFDIGLSGENDPINNITCHGPVTPGKSLKPFSLKLPSLDGKTMACELYSKNWVLFQPNIVIDAKLGCLWYVTLQLKPLQTIVIDRVRLVEFLLLRTNGKSSLISVLNDMINYQYSGMLLPIIESVFHKLNIVYKNSLDCEIQSQMGTTPSTSSLSSSSSKQLNKTIVPPRVLINQNDLYTNVFSIATESDHIGKVLMIYLQSLAKHKIIAEDELSRMIIIDLIEKNDTDTLELLFNYNLLSESKPLACLLLSLSNIHPTIFQLALDMLHRLNAIESILEVLLENGKVIDALRISKQIIPNDIIQARKYLEAAQKTNDPIIYHSVYMHFNQRDFRSRSTDYLKSDQFAGYIKTYMNLFNQL